MKKITLMALIAIFPLSFALTAQNRGGGRQSNERRDTAVRWTAKERAEAMAKELDLSDKEKEQVATLFEKQDKERAEQVTEQRAERGRAIGDRNAQREEMMKLREKAVAENDAELEKIIGKEKMKKWQEYRAERQNLMRSDSRRGGAGPRR